MSELKKCPFCGGNASGWYKTVRFGRIAYVECDVCGAKSKAFTYYATVDDFDENDMGVERATTAWNRRVDNG